MRSTRPDTSFDAAIKSARASASQAGRTITVVEARKALAALAPLAPTERAEILDRFLDSKAASHLSDAARKAFQEVVDVAPTSPTSPSQRFENAIDNAIARGKVKGTITKGEAEKALQFLGKGPSTARLIQAFLTEPRAAHLSPSARRVMEEAAADHIMQAFAAAFGREIGASKHTALLHEIRTVPAMSTAPSY